MKELIINTHVLIFENPDELASADRQLLEKARAALDQTYAPYSKFKVGAAVRLDNGQFLMAGNLENAAYPMCLCAERAVLAAVHAQYPRSKVEALAVVVKSSTKIIKEPASPCGACRQVLTEQEETQLHPIELLMQGETGPIYRLNSCASLLPLSFGKSFLA